MEHGLEDYVVADPEFVPEGADDLVGMDLGVALCRQDYDNNGLDFGNKVRRDTDFCCQVVQMDADQEVVLAKISIARSVSSDQDGFQIDERDYSMGALLFDGAHTIVGSIATMVATAMMFQ